MGATFYFYDLETSGFNPREARIMQFAGRRTDLKMKPIGDPDNIIIKLTEDTLPEPDAILVTGITPQQTLQDGVTEAEFLKYFHNEIVEPDTIFVGFNTVRFDDEFMRFLHYRNFYDPYEWEWRENRSRWDILDVVRMTRALRPDGITWPFDSSGKASNRLEFLTSVNKLSHSNAHDALSDVEATIAVARMIHNKQPKLFEYLLEMRKKKNVEKIVNTDKPFVYTSGKYNGDFEKTTVVGLLAKHPSLGDAAVVFDLRYDPAAFVDLSPKELADAMKRRSDEEGPRLPVKTLKYNRCPAVAPIVVLDEKSKTRLNLKMELIEKNFKTLITNRDKLASKLNEALEMLDKYQQAKFIEDNLDADSRLYEGFFNDSDRTKMSLVRATDPNELTNLDVVFNDGRLQALLPLYKARNFPKSLNDNDLKLWEQFKERRLMGGGADSKAVRYFKRLDELLFGSSLTAKNQYLIEELKLYGESILPLY
ncbi:MAG: exodeoxyribonuclease I [Candidatus Saccharimonadales bacterium]